MAGHVDILDDEETLWPTLVASMVLHMLLFGSMYGFSQAQGKSMCTAA